MSESGTTATPPLVFAVAALEIDASGAVVHADDWAHELYAADGNRLEGLPAAAVMGPAWWGDDGGEAARATLAAEGYWASTVRHRSAGGEVEVDIILRQRCDGEGRPAGLSVNVERSDQRAIRQRLLEQLGDSERIDRLRAALSHVRLGRLQAVATRLIAAPTVESIADVVCGEAVPAVAAYGGTVTVTDPATGTIRYLRAVGYPAETMRQWATRWVDVDTPLSHSLRHAEPVWLGSVEERDQRFPAVAGTMTRAASWCTLPLRLDGPAFGAMGFSFGEAHEFDRDERRFLQAMAYQCALAIDRARSAAGAHQPPTDRRRARAELELGVRVEDIRHARRLAAGVCAGLPPERVLDVQLCVDELLTNVALHAGTATRVRMTWEGDSVLVEVDDGVPGPLAVGDAEPDDVGGRGLLIVDTVASAWGVETKPWGKTVWARLDVRAS